MIKIRKVLESSENDLNQINILIPQLSKSARPLTIEELDHLISSTFTHLYLAEDDDKILGMLSLVIFQIPTGLRAWVEDVVVHFEARGKGIGKKLTLHALSEAKEFGVTSIDLTSRPSRETANKLYQSLGFEPRLTNVYRFKHIQ